MKFREATKEDFDFVADHSVSRGKVHPDKISFLYALEHDGLPLGMGGFQLMNYDTAWCWVDLTDLAGGHIRTVYRVLKEWIEKFMQDQSLTRLQATSGS